EREQPAGAFNVDLVAEEEGGGTAVIENQLEKSDHDHLGKLITYVANYQAKYAIWIVADPRPEHTQAINWLNEAGITAFYLLKIEAIKIGDSLPAPLLTLIVGPSQESLEVGETKKEMAERDTLRYKFWTELLERAKERTNLHSNITPGQYSWIGVSSGKRGLNYNYTVRQNEAVTELYIDRGKETEQENQTIFDQLLAHKDAIESSFGSSLHWGELEGKRACRIKKVIQSGGYRSEEETWPAIHEAMIDHMIRLEAALSPYINQLNI
ncbi:MAG: DUF4268 domain-containing protein, partial [Cyanobacteria bacterium J06555_13]